MRLGPSLLALGGGYAPSRSSTRLDLAHLGFEFGLFFAHVLLDPFAGVYVVLDIGGGVPQDIGDFGAPGLRALDLDRESHRFELFDYIIGG